MPIPSTVYRALLILALSAGSAWPQSVGAPGTLPPPRPVQPQTAPQPAPTPAPAPAPTPSPSSSGASSAPRRQQPTPTATAPAARATQPASRPAPAATPAPATRPAAQAQQRPPAQPPTVGSTRPPANRRAPGTAAGAAGAAAGAAAGTAAASSRAPEPAQPLPASPPPLPAPSVGPSTGLPLPRFAALRSDQVNMRVGPNTTFPIEWTFQRRDLPVMIIGEFQVWRRIRDVDGAEGWVHQSTLTGRRTALVRPTANAAEIPLRDGPEDAAPTVARLRPGVIARIRECEAGRAWCEVQVAGHRGWLRRNEVWGVLPEEEVKS